MKKRLKTIFVGLIIFILFFILVLLQFCTYIPLLFLIVSGFRFLIYAQIILPGFSFAENLKNVAVFLGLSIFLIANKNNHAFARDFEEEIGFENKKRLDLQPEKERVFNIIKELDKELEDELVKLASKDDVFAHNGGTEEQYDSVRVTRDVIECLEKQKSNFVQEYTELLAQDQTAIKNIEKLSTEKTFVDLTHTTNKHVLESNADPETTQKYHLLVELWHMVYNLFHS